MAPAKLAQCICGSIKIWPSSGEEEEASTGRYFVDGFLLIPSSNFVDSGGNYRNKKYYKTSETTIVNGESYPVYLSEDGLYKIKAEVVKSIVLLRIYDSSDVYCSITLGNAEDSLTPENLFVDLSEVNYWASAGEDESVTLTEVPAPAIKITLTPVRSDSNILAYGDGTYALQESLTTTYGGKTYPVYYCSTNKMYLFVASGNDSSLTTHSPFLTPGNIYLSMKPNEYADWRWSELGAAPTSFAFLRTSYLSYLNSTSWTDFINDQGETTSFTNWGGLSVKTIELSLSSGGSSSESGSNIKLQGFTGTIEDTGGTYQVDEEYNGVYTNTGTTNTVSYPDYSTGEIITVTAPVYYNGARYLFLTDYQNQPTWAVGTTSSSMEYACTSTGSELSSIIGTNGWLYGGMYSSIQITASWTDEAQSHGRITGTLTITFSPNPTGAAYIVNGTQYSSGQSATLEVGTYTVTYATVSGYRTPASEEVTITANQTTSFTRVYTYEGVIILPPDVFNATGAPVNYSNGATEDTAAINGTYTKTAQNTTYNNITYPIYYNGYYYLYCSNDGYACLAKTATSTTSYWSASYCKNVNGQMFATEMTGQWSAPMGMGTSYALTFTSSSSGTQDYGKLVYEPVDTTKPYLNVSGTSGYDGNYYLLSGTVDQPINTSSQNASSVWKHETNNWFILGFNTSSNDSRKGYHVYSSPNRTQLWGSYYPEGTKLASLTSTGTTTDSAYAFFNGGYTYGGVTTTLNMNGNSISPAEITFNYSTPSTDNGWSIYDKDNVLLSSGYNQATVSLNPGNYKIRIYCPGSNGEYTISSMSSSPNVFNSSYNSMTTGTSASPKTGRNVYWRQHEASLSSGTSVVVNASFDEQSSCLVEGTMITLADGTKKPIEEITYDDELLCWDFDKGEYGSAKPATIKPVVYRDTYFINTFNDGSVLLTQGLSDKGHELFDMTQSKFDYNARMTGHDVFTQDGVKNLVSSQEVWTIEPKKIYHIITAQHYNLFADGVLTSVRLNNMYPIVDMVYDKTQANVPAASEQLAQIPDQSLIEKFRMSEQPAKNFDYVLELSKQLQ